jgi:hypothetical protein
MQIGLNRGSAWLVEQANFNTEAERNEAKQRLLAMERDLEGVLRRYALFLPDSDAAPLLKLIPPIQAMGEARPQSAESEKYWTPELEAMDIVIAEYWLNHDPSRPPKKETIVARLKELGVSQGVAKSLDTAMRAPAARRGGKKRVLPKKPSK